MLTMAAPLVTLRTARWVDARLPGPPSWVKSTAHGAGAEVPVGRRGMECVAASNDPARAPVAGHTALEPLADPPVAANTHPLAASRVACRAMAAPDSCASASLQSQSLGSGAVVTTVPLREVLRELLRDVRAVREVRAVRDVRAVRAVCRAVLRAILAASFALVSIRCHVRMARRLADA